MAESTGAGSGIRRSSRKPKDGMTPNDQLNTAVAALIKKRDEEDQDLSAAWRAVISARKLTGDKRAFAM
jgi:hypothetical protein